MPLPSHYHDPDATFARHFATLRTDLGLTQTALAERLGVTERAIQRWEGGTRSPRAAYLKSFLALCIEQHLFPESQEVEQARTLWKAAHLKVLLDERWLLGLLDKQAPPPVESAREIMPVPQEAMHPLDLRKNSSEISFYGREHEQAQLTTWIREDRCRLIALLGMGGIGKSSLATRLLHQLAPFFTTTTFRSVRDAMPCEELIAHLIQALAPEEPLAQVPSTLDRQMTLLIDLLQQRRCLVVIDNVETLLQEGEHAGRYRPGYEEYGRFFERVGSTQHQSCVLLTSREKPVEFHAMEGSRTPVRALSLAGLDAGAGAQILVEKHLHGKEEERRRLIEVYSGNPLALKIVAETIHELFADEIAPFLTEGQVIFQGIRALLAQQFTRLTFLEQSIMFWLAIVREPVDVSTLLTRSVTKMPRLHVLEALEDLRRRSLVEHGSQRSLFTLQAVVMEYVTETLVKQMALEVQQRAPDALLIYGLSLASAKEYIRQSQERLLLIPVLFHLGATSHRKGVVEQHLLACLNSLRSSYEIEEQGYGPANLAMLLLHLKGHLQGLDFSGCGLREAALQGVQMQDASLHKSLMQENSFTDTFGAVFTVVVSHDGKYWALGSDMGQLYVFLHESGTPVLALNPHPGVRSIAFNADSTRMATSGRDDDLIKIWSLPQGTLIATLQGHSIDVRDIAFSPDGTRLAATGLDGTVRIWDLESLQVRHLLHSHKREVYAVAWSNDGQLLATAGEDSIHLWDGHSGRKIRTLVDQSNITLECAFSPDNRLLASGGTDKFVKVWDVASGVCLQSLAGHTHVVISVAWNPDGSFLASGSFDMTIRIWHAHSFALRQILSGHSSVVMSIAFTADGTRLFSGSFDRSVRLWEVASGDCISLITGFSLFCRAAAWSLRGDLLATTITDGRIMLWNPAEGTLVRVLQGHTQPLSSVTWSPDGQMLASGGGHDKTVRLWKTNTGECILTVNDYHIDIAAVSWSPDGCLLAYGGGPDNTIYVWDVEQKREVWIGRGHIDVIKVLTWSPDGKYLASCDDDATIRLWNAEDGTLFKVLKEGQEIIYDLAWSPDGTQLASTCGADIRIWDVASGTHVDISLDPMHILRAVAWSSQGDKLLAGGRGGAIYWFETDRWSRLAVHQEHQGTVMSIRISSDGRTAASTDSDGAIIIWNIAQATPLHVLHLERPYERLNISGIQGITEAQKTTLLALGAVGDL